MKNVLVSALTAALVVVCFYVLRPAEASRNSSGTYSTPNVFVPGTTISSTSVNSNFSDLATEMTDSLDRSGKGGMLAALRGVDGTVSAPAFSWTSETGSGWYRVGSSDLGLAISGIKQLELTSTLFTVVGTARFANGAVATPSVSFTNDTGSGLYRGGSSDLRFAVNGADRTFWNATGFGVGVAPAAPLQVLKTGSSGATPNASSSAVFESSAAHYISLLSPNSGSEAILFGDVANASRGQIQYYNSTNGSADQMQFGTGGSIRATISNSGLTIGSGTAISQLNYGSCALNNATPALCTATVVAGAKCTATTTGTTSAKAAITLAVSVASTTLTITASTGGITDTVNYICAG